MSSLAELAHFSKNAAFTPMAAYEQPKRRIPGAVPLAAVGGTVATYGGTQAVLAGTRRLKENPAAAKYARKVALRTAAGGALVGAAGLGVAVANRGR
jgi:hypothetical protein